MLGTSLLASAMTSRGVAAAVLHSMASLGQMEWVEQVMLLFYRAGNRPREAQRRAGHRHTCGRRAEGLSGAGCMVTLGLCPPLNVHEGDPVHPPPAAFLTHTHCHLRLAESDGRLSQTSPSPSLLLLPG